MRKLTLEVEALAVESFQTVAEPVEPRGTVEAHAITGSYTTCQTRRTYCDDTRCTCTPVLEPL
jgi:hypothetical protein